MTQESITDFLYHVRFDTFERTHISADNFKV